MAAWDGAGDGKYRHGTVDTPTQRALDAAEKIAGFSFVVTQGKGTGVAASAGTHNGWGVVDLRNRHLSDKQQRVMLLALRRVGFAAWRRFRPTFSTPHVHAALVGHPKLPAGAARQVKQYQQGLSGLASRRPDEDRSYAKGYYNWSWPKFLAAQSKAPAPQPAKKPGGPTISIGAIKLAQTSNVSHQVWEDVRYVAGFAHAIHAIPVTTLNALIGTNGSQAKGLGKLLTYTIKCIQAKGKIAQDGVFGQQTGAVMARYGYQIVP